MSSISPACAAAAPAKSSDCASAGSVCAAPIAQRIPSNTTRWTASRANTRAMACSSGGSKATAVVGAVTDRSAKIAAHSAWAMISPRRNSTCWLRVSRSSRQRSSSAASERSAVAAVPAPHVGCPAWWASRRAAHSL